MTDYRLPDPGIDLLTVVMHELGHLLGYEHSDDAHDLMAPVLAAAGSSPVERASSLSDLPGALASLQPWGLIILGLLVLMATPVARVVALLALFAWRRSWRFSAICVFVLAVLALSVFLGLRG